MAIEDFLEPEVAATAAVTAVVFSPRGRRLLRRGAVYGLAGLLVVGDALASVARGVGQGAQRVGASAAQAARTTMEQAQQKGETGQKVATEGTDS